MTKFDLAAPPGFRLPTVATSHGWFDLPPFRWNPEAACLATTIQIESHVVDLELRQPERHRIEAKLATSNRLPRKLAAAVKRKAHDMLGLEHDLGPFFKVAGPSFQWARKVGAGRLLRAPTAFEDAVKILATTNCSWSLTKLMIARLVDALGTPGPSGMRAFPTAEAMAAQPEKFYRDQMKAGYRSRYFKAFADGVAMKTIDPEAWPVEPGDTASLIKRIRQNPGFGAYAAENLCRLFGRHDGLGLDSWCANKFPKIHGPVEGNVETAIRAHYDRFGKFRGLALWLDLTKDWHDDARFTKPNRSFEKDWT